MATANLRKGYLLGLATFSIWGMFPLYFKALEQYGALEIVTQRVIWSAVFGSLVLLVWRHPGWWRELLAHPRRLGVLGISSVLIAANWLIYVWAVNHDRMVEASLGYYINPLVNNAGVQRHAAFLDVQADDYDQVLNVNLRGPFFLAQAFARHLREQGRGGRIINNSSVHEELPHPNFTAYCASKGGLKMLMRNIAIELAPLGITVNNVAPGAVETPINRELMNQPDKLANLLQNIPAGRLGRPHDVAGVVAFLASPDAEYITGTTLVVDGGLLWNYSEQ